MIGAATGYFYVTGVGSRAALDKAATLVGDVLPETEPLGVVIVFEAAAG